MRSDRLQQYLELGFIDEDEGPAQPYKAMFVSIVQILIDDNL